MREYIGYALGDTASNFFYQTVLIFLTNFYTDIWGISTAVLATMTLVIRLSDALVDPVIGLLADRTVSRWGKFRPYLLWGAAPFGAAGYLLFASPDLSAHGKIVYAYATYAFMMLAYSVVNVPYSSLLGVISTSSRTRTQASSYRFIGAFGGGLLVTLFVKKLVLYFGGGLDAGGHTANPLRGYQWTMAIFAVAAVALFWICFAWTTERVKPARDQRSNVVGELGELINNRPWVILLVATIFSVSFIGLRNGTAVYYLKYVSGYDDKPVFWFLDHTSLFLSTGMLAQMLGAICLSFVARTADKRLVATLLTLVTAVAFGAFYFIPKENFGLQLGINALGFLCMGPASALVWSMYADVADYGEWKFNRRSTGLVYSATLFANKFGTVVAGWLLPSMLGAFGYVANATQTAHSLWGIALTFSIIPAAFAGLKGLMLWVYPLSQSTVDVIERDLKTRRTPAPAPA